MIEEIRLFLKNNLLVTLFGISFLIGSLNAILSFYFVNKLNSLVILHYNVYLGVDLMGESSQIYWMPLIGILFLFVNLVLAIYFFSKKERMLSHILSLSTLIIQLGVAVASGSLILVNYF